MKILVVDDSPDKVRDICALLSEFDLISAGDIDVRSDSASAKGALSTNYYDLLILDIYLPPDSASGAEINEGIKFLEHITITKTINVPLHIVGMTAHKDILEESQVAFGEKIWSVIYFDPANTSWKEQLSQKVKYLIRLTGRFSAIEPADVVLITSVRIETQSALGLPLNWLKFSVPNDPSIYYRGEISSDLVTDKSISVVTTSCLRMGMVASAISVSKMISHFSPKYVVMIGICGGADPKLDFGDIIVGDPVWSYESGKYVDSSGDSLFLPAPHQINLSSALRAFILDHITTQAFVDDIEKSWSRKKPESALNSHLGPIGSGSAVLADGRLIRPITNQHRQVLGIDMEAYGLMAASVETVVDNPHRLVIKSICDFADKAKSDDWQPYAAYTSAQYFYLLFKMMLEDGNVDWF